MTTQTPPPHMQLAIMSREYVVSRAIHVIANLGLADHMSDQPVAVQELARLTNTNATRLARLLNFLCNYGLFVKKGESYALTPLSQPLQQDHPNSIKDILSMVDEAWWQAFAQLETSLKSDESAFVKQHGTPFFDFLNSNPEKKTRFARGIKKLAAFDDEAITKAFHFEQFNSLCDLNGPQSDLMKILANSCPDLHVSNYDLRSKINQEHLELGELPPAEAYYIKGILHDFDEEKIKAVLNQCHQQMGKEATLIIAEQIMPDDHLPHTNKTMDIIMMVLVGGSQRTQQQWQILIESTGFTLENTYPTTGVYSIMTFKTVGK